MMRTGAKSPRYKRRADQQYLPESCVLVISASDSKSTGGGPFSSCLAGKRSVGTYPHIHGRLFPEQILSLSSASLSVSQPASVQLPRFETEPKP